jgi:hypothetical protein
MSTYQSGSATCPAGKHAVGGGYRADRRYSNGSSIVYNSNTLYTQPDGTQWIVALNVPDAGESYGDAAYQGTDVTVWAVCLS